MHVFFLQFRRTTTRLLIWIILLTPFLRSNYAICALYSRLIKVKIKNEFIERTSKPSISVDANFHRMTMTISISSMQYPYLRCVISNNDKVIYFTLCLSWKMPGKMSSPFAIGVSATVKWFFFPIRMTGKKKLTNSYRKKYTRLRALKLTSHFLQPFIATISIEMIKKKKRCWHSYKSYFFSCVCLHLLCLFHEFAYFNVFGIFCIR